MTVTSRFLQFGAAALPISAFFLEATFLAVLLFGRDHSAPEHVAHEMGSFGVFARAWADHEAMLTGLDELTQRAGKLREWVTAKHHATSA